MPHDPKTVDALLRTTVSRLMQAAGAANGAREMHRQGREVEYWRGVKEAADHATIAGHAIMEANRLMLADTPIFVIPEGGLPN